MKILRCQKCGAVFPATDQRCPSCTPRPPEGENDTQVPRPRPVPARETKPEDGKRIGLGERIGLFILSLVLFGAPIFCILGVFFLPISGKFGTFAGMLLSIHRYALAIVVLLCLGIAKESWPRGLGVLRAAFRKEVPSEAQQSPRPSLAPSRSKELADLYQTWSTEQLVSGARIETLAYEPEAVALMEKELQRRETPERQSYPIIGATMNTTAVAYQNFAGRYTSGEPIQIAGTVFWNVIEREAERGGLAGLGSNLRAQDVALGVLFGGAGVLASAMTHEDEPAKLSVISICAC
jgi:hypothetical protein